MGADELRLLCVAAYSVYKSNLIGGGAPITQERLRYLKPRDFGGNPFQVGDPIMEITTIWDESRDEYRIGYLVSDKEEPMFSDEEWAKVADEYDNEMPTERAVRIKTLASGQEFRWTNADFIRIPRGLKEFP